MKLYLENHNELDKVCNEFSAKEDLVNLLDTTDQLDQAFSPMEAAALQLTMRQIDPSMISATTESYGQPIATTVILAHEALKDNIANAWKKFLEVLKRIGAAIKEKAKQFTDFLRGKRKRKAGEENAGFEREEIKDETPPETPEGETPSFKKDQVMRYFYKMPLAYFEVGDEADERTFLRRICANVKLAKFASEIDEIYSTKNIAQAAMDAETEEEWLEFLGLTSYKVADILTKELGAQREGDFLVAYITEHLTIKFDMTESGTWPVLELDLAGGHLSINGDIVAYATDLEKAIEITKKDVSKYVMWEVPNFQRISDERAKDRLMGLMPLYSKRAKFSTDLGKLIETIIGAAEGILADISGEVTDAYM